MTKFISVHIKGHNNEEIINLDYVARFVKKAKGHNVYSCYLVSNQGNDFELLETFEEIANKLSGVIL